MLFNSEYRWTSFLIVVGVVCLAYPIAVIIKHSSGTSYTSSENVVMGLGANLIVMVTGLVGLQQSQKKTRHDLKNGQNLVNLTAEGARLTAEEATRKLNLIQVKIEELDKLTNGNLSNAIQQVAQEVRVSDGMIPFSEVKQLVLDSTKDQCQEMATQAAVRAIMLYQQQHKGTTNTH